MADSSAEQKRYVKFPIDSVQSCVDRLGLWASDEVSSGLAEDLNFRIRQITDTACQFMHHSKRRCLMMEDMDRAIKYSGLEPVYGHSETSPRQYEDIMLDQLALTTGSQVDDHTLPKQIPQVTGSWQAIEGVKLSDAELLEGKVQLTENMSESRQNYLSMLLEAIGGEDEEKRRVALSVIQTNLAIANILPGLTQYLQQTLVDWKQFTLVQLCRILKLTLALFKNTGLFLAPYSSIVYPLLKDILLSEFSSSEGEVDRWHTRQLLAMVIAQLLKRTAFTTNSFYQELSSELLQFFGSPHQLSLPVLYGTVLVVTNLGPASIAEVLLPNFEGISKYLGVITKTAGMKNDASQLHEAILVAAELLLASDVRVPLVPAMKSVDHSSGEPNNTGVSRSGESAFFGSSGSLSSLATTESGSVLGGEISESTGTKLSYVEPTQPSTLYDYLVEIFGESLTLNLFAHSVHGFNSSTPSKPGPTKTHTIPDKVENSRHANQSLENFLIGEGFRPIRVQLPKRSPPAPSVPRGYYRGRQPWTFSIPQAILPVAVNALEHRNVARTDPSRSRSEESAIVRRICVGHQRKQNRGKLSLIDVSKSWI